MINDKSLLTDEQIIHGILNNDSEIISYFFYEKCSSLFGYIIKCMFDGNVEKDELISELYVYLSDKDWNKLRQFAFKSSLLTWIGVVSIRYFQKIRHRLIDNPSSESLLSKIDTKAFQSIDEYKIDIETALSKMSNNRYRRVISELDLKDRAPEIVAREMDISVANLYNLRRRAHLQLLKYLV